MPALTPRQRFELAMLEVQAEDALAAGGAGLRAALAEIMMLVVTEGIGPADFVGTDRVRLSIALGTCEVVEQRLMPTATE